MNESMGVRAHWEAAAGTGVSFNGARDHQGEPFKTGGSVIDSTGGHPAFDERDLLGCKRFAGLRHARGRAANRWDNAGEYGTNSGKAS
jgi:hypothetical protein